MTKFHVTEHAVADAPVERVWEVVSRTDRYAEVTSVFEFEPVRGAEGREATRMTYKAEYVIGLGPVGLLLDRIQQPGMRANMRTSMANLNTLIRSETLNTRG
ncbi:hypothetical protein [Streptomyces phaeochromogenes]|uniref:hypothetical protein n=1 Tax=Streptomyces phaeochromogenes TaxID=1923 RepID=UPI0038636324|nr:hypothetical protein OHB08_45330 [Streptomyces phaeochromogenes]